MSIVQQICSVVARHARVEERLVTEHTSLTRQLNLDSLQRVEILLELEDLFGIELPDTISTVDTPQTVADAISSIIASKK